MKVQCVCRKNEDLRMDLKYTFMLDIFIGNMFLISGCFLYKNRREYNNSHNNGRYNMPTLS